MNYCPSCGTEVKPEDAFCSSCGTSLGEHALAQETAPQASGGLRPGQLELIGFLLIVAGMFGGFALRPLFFLMLVGFVVFLGGRFSR